MSLTCSIYHVCTRFGQVVRIPDEMQHLSVLGFKMHFKLVDIMGSEMETPPWAAAGLGRARAGRPRGLAAAVPR